MLIYSIKVNTYIAFWTLKVKCTQYGMCGEVAFKIARAMVFSKSDGAGKSFRLGQEDPDFLVGQLPLPVSTSPERLDRSGEGIVRPSKVAMLCLFRGSLHYGP